MEQTGETMGLAGNFKLHNVLPTIGETVSFTSAVAYLRRTYMTPHAKDGHSSIANQDWQGQNFKTRTLYSPASH
jgi:hypothetical protein